MIFLTEDKKNKEINTPRIIANSWREAERKCPKHLKVIGKLIEEE